MQLKYQFAIRTRFRISIKRLLVVYLYICVQYLETQFNKESYEWSQFQHSHCIHYYSMHGPLVCNIKQFHSVVSQEKIFRGLTLNFLYSNYLCYFFPNVGVTILLRNFNNTYSKDYLSLISKNYIEYLSKFLHFVHF